MKVGDTIGSVKIEVDKDERPYHQFTFGDIECIKYLIRVRSKIDKYFGVSEDNCFDHAGVVEPVNQELICLYADLDNYISKIELNIKERHVLSRLMNGYTVGDIAKEFNRHRKEIYRTFEKICVKIKEENDIAWKYDYMYASYFRVP